MEILIQIIGFVAVAVGIIAVQFNTHSKIMFFKTLGSVIFSIQFLLLGAFTGMVMEIIGAIRNIVFAYNVKKDRSNKWWIMFFCIITLGLGITTVILSWNTTMKVISNVWSKQYNVVLTIAIIASILSILSKIISTIAFGFKTPHMIRVTTIPACSMWLVYNIFVFNLAEIISEVMCISSNIIAEIRFRKNPDGVEENHKHFGACDCASCNAMLMTKEEEHCECGCHDHNHHDEDDCGCHDHNHHDEDNCGCHDHNHHDEDDCDCGCHDHDTHHKHEHNNADHFFEKHIH